MKKNPAELIGTKVLKIAETLGGIVQLFIQTIKSLFQAPFEGKNIIKQMVAIGVKSFPIVALAALFSGMVFAFQLGDVSVRWLGAPTFVAMGTAIALMKELAPVISALIISGKVGAQIAAELGTMKVTEQIDALHTLGTNPIKYLSVPRFLSCLIGVPVLTLFADAIGIFGGSIVAAQKFGIPPNVYWNEILEYVRFDAVAHGLIKSFFFGLIIVVVSCYEGLSCEGGAEGVGKSTTTAVVVSMLLILIANYLITVFLTAIGLGG